MSGHISTVEILPILVEHLSAAFLRSLPKTALLVSRRPCLVEIARTVPGVYRAPPVISIAILRLHDALLWYPSPRKLPSGSSHEGRREVLSSSPGNRSRVFATPLPIVENLQSHDVFVRHQISSGHVRLM